MADTERPASAAMADTNEVPGPPAAAAARSSPAAAAAVSESLGMRTTDAPRRAAASAVVPSDARAEPNKRGASAPPNGHAEHDARRLRPRTGVVHSRTVPVLRLSSSPHPPGRITPAQSASPESIMRSVKELMRPALLPSNPHPHQSPAWWQAQQLATNARHAPYAAAELALCGTSGGVWSTATVPDTAIVFAGFFVPALQATGSYASRTNLLIEKSGIERRQYTFDDLFPVSPNVMRELTHLRRGTPRSARCGCATCWRVRRRRRGSPPCICTAAGRSDGSHGRLAWST